MGWSNLLLDGEVAPEKHRQAIETIARNANSQCQLIDDLLEVSRIITGKLRLDFAPCALQPIIQAATESIRPTAEAKGVRLECSLPPEIDVVYGDSERLQQVVWNLLSNAVKFTPAGGSVQIELKQINSHAAISVQDTGTGIKPDFLPYVFDRFRQADGSTTRAFGGLGLGLAIVRHLVELHGGNASAESEGENHGSTFVVRLPLVQSMDHGLHPLHPPVSRPATAIRTDPATGLSGIRVLMVDDEFDARELVVTMLEKDGAQVKAVGSAKEALEEIGVWKPDVLIADIGMPDEDGYGLIRRVRALSKEQGGATPALALTAYARTEDRARALSAGYQVHLSKPVDRSELAAVICRLSVGVR